jgi:uncharacterized protein (TIGR03083 family)
METDPRRWITALRRSHDRLAGIVRGLSPAQVAGPSYCSEWTTAQVLSHLGSGAEIGLGNLEAMVAGQPPPPREGYQAIWDRWNGKTPDQMAADFLDWDERYVAHLEGLSDAQLASLSMPFMGRTLDAAGIVGMRLAEHAAHTWDVEVMADPKATVQPEAVELVIDLLSGRIARLARGEKPAGSPLELQVDTVGPSRSFFLKIGDEVSLTTERGDPAGKLSLPSEAFFRLTYGRMDDGHTPPETVIEGPASLDELRRLFPGF